MIPKQTQSVLLVALVLISQGSAVTAKSRSSITASQADFTTVENVDVDTDKTQKHPLKGKVSSIKGDAETDSTATKPLKGSALKKDVAMQLQRQRPKAQDTNKDANVNESQLSAQNSTADKVNERDGDNYQHGHNEPGGVNEPNGDNNQSGSNN